MNKILLPEVEEVSYKVNIETFVKNQCKPEKANDKIVSLIKYNLSKGSIRIHRLYIGLKPVTNNFCYRKIIMYFFYTQLAEINHEKIYKIKEKQQTEMLSKEERQFLNLANDYKKQLETVLSDFKVPDIYLDGQTIENLAANEMVAPFITGTITGKYPNTMVLNNVVKNASFYYDILRTPITQNNKIKEAYLSTREALEKACNILSFNETYYSIKWNNHANSVLTKSVTMDIISRYYKGRFINNQTGKVVRRFDNHGTRMRKEIVLACLEKFQK